MFIVNKTNYSIESIEDYLWGTPKYIDQTYYAVESKVLSNNSRVYFTSNVTLSDDLDLLEGSMVIGNVTLDNTSLEGSVIIISNSNEPMVIKNSIIKNSVIIDCKTISDTEVRDSTIKDSFNINLSIIEASTLNRVFNIDKSCIAGSKVVGNVDIRDAVLAVDVEHDYPYSIKEINGTYRTQDTLVIPYGRLNQDWLLTKKNFAQCFDIFNTYIAFNKDLDQVFYNFDYENESNGVLIDYKELDYIIFVKNKKLNTLLEMGIEDSIKEEIFLLREELSKLISIKKYVKYILIPFIDNDRFDPVNMDIIYVSNI